MMRGHLASLTGLSQASLTTVRKLSWDDHMLKYLNGFGPFGPGTIPVQSEITEIIEDDDQIIAEAPVNDGNLAEESLPAEHAMPKITAMGTRHHILASVTVITAGLTIGYQMGIIGDI
ncbi:hypothetical protein NE237_029105 [Protea cynaroides]|uniref:Uncharacterized protein n=1 Tax=Protea cynaroides TaxID=273540 RepID=A0A9Q0GR80_9MAGN|nr:hypothetical protein NE237_029105 [Protea cynaroides]